MLIAYLCCGLHIGVALWCLPASSNTLATSFKREGDWFTCCPTILSTLHILRWSVINRHPLWLVSSLNNKVGLADRSL